MAVHHEAVFVGAGSERGFLPPVAGSGGIQRLGFRLPVVERSREADGFGRWMRELKTNGGQLQAGVLGVVVIVIMLQIC